MPPAKVDVAVEVALMAANVGVEVDTILVPLNARSMWLPSDVAFVPPLAMPSADVSERAFAVNVVPSKVRFAESVN
jgi:hypothetical protein